MSLICPKGDQTPAPTADSKQSAVLSKEYNGSDILRHRSRADDKCSIKEFTSKRREMLLLNLSIQTQQEEIDKLHADLAKKEHDLHEKEAGLDREQLRYDQFLKDIDQQAQSSARLLDEQLEIKASALERVAALERELHIVDSGIKQQTDKIEQSQGY